MVNDAPDLTRGVTLSLQSLFWIVSATVAVTWIIATLSCRFDIESLKREGCKPAIATPLIEKARPS